MKNLKSLTDDRLVALYVSGDNEAFDALLERHKNKLYSYIYYNVRNADMADDIFQETFVKVIMTLRQGRYVESGKFGSWLTRIAHNLIIDQFRTEQNECTVSNDEVETDLFAAAGTTDYTIEAKMMTEQALSEVSRLIELLPESQLEIIRMRIYQNLSFKEIAQIKGISINTALGRMRYAVLNLRKMAQERHLSLAIN